MKIQFLLLSLLITGFIRAQNGNTDTVGAAVNLKSAAQKMAGFLTRGNYTEFIKYMHPRALQMAGGKDKIIAMLQASSEQSNSQGFTIDSVCIGDPLPIMYAGKELQGLVPEKIILKIKQGKLVTTSYLLAVSDNKGKTWYFIDTSNKTLAQLQTVLPSLSNQLVIPPRTKPILYSN